MKKYLIKYTLEFIVIVTGISLSFWINEWDNNRMNSDKELYFLNGLKNDLEKQLNSLNNYNEFSNQTIDYGASILEDYSIFETLSKTDSLNIKLSRLMYSRSYPEINTTFNELKSTGQFNLFKEKLLASKVIKYYQDSENYKNRLTKNIDIVYYNEIFPIIKSSIIIDPNNFGYENKKINILGIEKSLNIILNNSKKEFELANAISLRIVVANTNKAYIEIMIKEAKILLDMINNELIKY
ncbi:MAG: hypothetical protein CMB87_00820 [Flammeovirgaceae bacterium]|nr:hypothetical protein [Flammeovirgaceae bacterium]|tara:strand:+ start:938 stop:1657 length:720 start_codon:yes stop_codon:yes gene_type:complete